MDRGRRLGDLQGMVKELEADLLERATEDAAIDAELRATYAVLRKAERTAQAFEPWREEHLTQVAVAWVIACVFVRYLEDGGLLGEALLAGREPARAKEADDAYRRFIEEHPLETDREYLLSVFDRVGKAPAAADLFAEGKTPLRSLGPSADGARRLRHFWSERDPESGELRRDFRTEDGDTRLLGDLYQDLSESARDRYALLQTPEFVEEFILDRTLTPAIEELGLGNVRVIDPTCGSGHFLLGAFRRLFDEWTRREPGGNPRDHATRALDAVHGIDLNPYAAAIARFRLVVAALRAAGLRRIEEAPKWPLWVAAGDTLLHGVVNTPGGEPRPLRDEMELRGDEHQEALWRRGIEEPEALWEILVRRQPFPVVVGNPPYKTVKDKLASTAYRERYATCYRQYSLGVPFTERFFGCASPGQYDPAGGGYVGLITANSFMKREFGKRLIERFVPRVDLTHVIDTSGAYIPGHGTPTVILIGRNRRPVGETVRAVMGIRGEPSTPEVPAEGHVWRSIVENLDTAGAETEYVSVVDLEREVLGKHPWSIGGGGAAELKERLDKHCAQRLSDVCKEIGFVCMTRADDVYFTPRAALRRAGVPHGQIIENVEGERVRDWGIHEPNTTLFPYQEDLTVVPGDPSNPAIRFLWPYRAILWLRREPNGNHRELGMTWYEWSRFQRDRFRTPLSIAFAFVATHNHFVLDRGGKVFNRSAPIIKLPPEASEEEHLALLGLLNSSTACFWMKQVFHNKGARGIGGGFVSEEWEQFFEFTAAGLGPFPVCEASMVDLATALDGAARSLAGCDPLSVCSTDVPTEERLSEARTRFASVRSRMIALQEELDWRCYEAYGLTSSGLTYGGDPPSVEFGQRPFEYVLSRRLEAGTCTSTWFERNRSTPTTDLPSDWPADYRALVERRIALIESDRDIALIEQPEHKRRWNVEPWEPRVERALRAWLLDRLESPRYFPPPDAEPPSLTSCARLADVAARDEDFLRVAALYRGREDFDIPRLVEELVASEAVPFLPVLRYKPSGLRKRAVWERTWELQRAEDRGEEVGEIAVPPKYTSGDFRRAEFWRARGKLDVPKERFVSYPGLEREGDPSLVVGWAGWDHLQQAAALVRYYHERKSVDGWEPSRLLPILAGLDQLLPWVGQWHDEVDPASGERPGPAYEAFLESELLAFRATREEAREWSPPAPKRGRRGGGRKKAAGKTAGKTADEKKTSKTTRRRRET